MSDSEETEGSGLRKWLDSRLKRKAARYEEAKEEFERAMGKPSITITVELPEGLDELKAEFLSLEEDERFLGAVKRLVERRLKRAGKGRGNR